MRLDKPLVSIIIPTVNSQQFLERCLLSIEKQTDSNTEVIVVDNDSRDKTREIAQKYGAKVILFVGIRSAARNVGVQAAKGKFILSIDSDMELTPSVIEECMDKAQSGYDAIIIPEYSVGEGFWAKCKALEKSCYVGDRLIEAARFFRKGVFNDVKRYDQNLEFGEDWDLNLRICGAGYRIGRIKAPIKHNEGKLRLWNSVSKKSYYGRSLASYRIKHPKEAKQQLQPIRPAFLRNWKNLAKDPIHAIGMLFMKTCEFGATELMQIICDWSRDSER